MMEHIVASDRRQAKTQNNGERSSSSSSQSFERLLSLLVAFWTSVLGAWRELWTFDYLPRVYTPKEPAYFQIARRDRSTIVTHVLTELQREKQAQGLKTALHDVPGTEHQAPLAYVAATKTKRELETVSVRSMIEARCPSMFKDYVPSWWLRLGHTNTIYCILGDFTKTNVVNYERTLLRLADGGTIGLDLTPPRSERILDPKTPIIVALHGLSGGSFESYIRDILSTACAPKEAGGLGYRACVMNFRGCAGVPLTTAQLYSGAHLDDWRATLLYLRQEYPEAPLIGIGFSLGANVLLRYCEEEGDHSRLRSAIVLGCPWDLRLNSDRLEKRWMYRNMYAKAMGGNLLFLLRSHLQTLNKLAPTRATPHIEHILKMRAPTLKDFDHHVTRWMGGSAPQFPMESAEDYYTKSSGHDKVHMIRIPFLALNASDDPIVAETPHEEVENRSKYVVQLVTPFGGHLGWFTGRPVPSFANPPERWVRKPVLEWLQAVGDDLSAQFDFASYAFAEGDDGFVREKERPQIGYRVLIRGGHVKKPQGIAARFEAAGSAMP